MPFGWVALLLGLCGRFSAGDAPSPAVIRGGVRLVVDRSVEVRGGLDQPYFGGNGYGTACMARCAGAPELLPARPSASRSVGGTEPPADLRRQGATTGLNGPHGPSSVGRTGAMLDSSGRRIRTAGSMLAIVAIGLFA